MIKKNLTRGLQFACGVAVVAAAIGATTHTNYTKAAASAPSGVCGILLTANAAGYTGKNQSFGSGSTTLTGVINFNNNTGNLTVTDVQNYNLSNAYNTLQNSSITVTPGAAQSNGGYKVTFTDNTDTSDFLFMPTNSNNTYLVSSYNTQTTANGSPAWSGVCQVQ